MFDDEDRFNNCTIRYKFVLFKMITNKIILEYDIIALNEDYK